MLQEIHDDLTLMTPPEQQVWGWWVGTGVVFALLAALVVRLVLRRRRRRRARVEPPEKRAWGRLAGLKDIEGRALYAELCDVFGEYLGARYGVIARNLTSQEIRRELERRGVNEGDAWRAVDAFLALADCGKFGAEEGVAARDTSVEACREAVRQLSLTMLAAPRLTAIEGVGNAA